jgi:hypothetical protein
MRKSGLVMVLLGAWLSGGCTLKSFPIANPSARQIALTTVAFNVDLAGAKVFPRYNYGRRYDLQRQAYSVEYSYYMANEFKLDPGLFYTAPKGLPDVKYVEKLREDKHATVWLIKWQSQYWPSNPDFALRYEKYIEDQTAWAILVQSRAPKNYGAIVIAHRWTGRDIRRTWKDENLLDYAQEGFDTVLVQMPYHGLRALPSAIFSGEQFLSGEVARTNEAMRQAVTDLRGMIGWMRSRDYEIVGLKGESLGATAALMTAVVDDDVDFVIAWKPLASIGELKEGNPMAPPAIKVMHAGGLDDDMIKKILWLSSPVNFNPAIKVTDSDSYVDRVIVFAGMGDVFTPPAQATMIAKKWNLPDYADKPEQMQNTRLVWYAGGYILNLQKGYCAQMEREFLAQIMADPGRIPETSSKDHLAAPKWYKREYWNRRKLNRRLEQSPAAPEKKSRRELRKERKQPRATDSAAPEKKSRRQLRQEKKNPPPEPPKPVESPAAPLPSDPPKSDSSWKWEGPK